MSQLVFNWGLQMRVKGLHKSIFNTSNLFWGGCVLLAGEGRVKNFFENVLLAGEMLEIENPTFNISPMGAFLGGVVCFWLGKC